MGAAPEKQKAPASERSRYKTNGLRVTYVEWAHRTARSDAMSFEAFAALKYLSLETFRKSGVGVRTPIWFAPDPARNLGTGNARVFVYTEADSGKVKRIRNNGRVRIAPCDMRGKISGDWVDARAEIVAGGDGDYGMRLLNKKYFPWKQLLDFFAKFRPHERVVLAILPAEARK